MFKFYSDSNVDIEFPCDTNIGGVCEKKQTLDECVEICEYDQNCKWGLYKNKLCYPVNNKYYPKLNPINFLTPEKNTTFFIKSDNISKFDKKLIMFYDIVKIKDVINDIILEPPIMLVHNTPYLNKKENTYPIQSNDNMIFIDPNENIMLIPEVNKVSWLKYFPIEYFFYTLRPINNNNNMITYDDSFNILTPTGSQICNVRRNRKLDQLIITKVYREKFCVGNIFKFILQYRQ